MPEAFAIFSVIAVIVAVGVVLRMHTQNPKNTTVRDEVGRLTAHAGWLQDRLARARRENWGGDMIVSLTAELDATTQKLMQATSGKAARETRV